MRLVITLSVAAAVTVMSGAILVLLGTVMRLKPTYPAGGLARLGLDVVAAGVASGLVVLVVFAFTRGRAAHRPPRRRASALNPTTVYSPGGLLDMPGEARGHGHPPRRNSGTQGSPGARHPRGCPARTLPRALVRQPRPPGHPVHRVASGAMTGRPRPVPELSHHGRPVTRG
jgi:hypothetical protein